MLVGCERAAKGQWETRSVSVHTFCGKAIAGHLQFWSLALARMRESVFEFRVAREACCTSDFFFPFYPTHFAYFSVFMFVFLS